MEGEPVGLLLGNEDTDGTLDASLLGFKDLYPDGSLLGFKDGSPNDLMLVSLNMVCSSDDLLLGTKGNDGTLEGSSLDFNDGSLGGIMFG